MQFYKSLQKILLQVIGSGGGGRSVRLTSRLISKQLNETIRMKD